MIRLPLLILVPGNPLGPGPPLAAEALVLYPLGELDPGG